MSVPPSSPPAWASTSSSGSWPAPTSLSACTAPSSFSSPDASLQVVHRTRISSTLRCFEGKFRNARGQSLFYFSLFPPVDKPLRGVVLFLHGTGDHCRRFPFLFERLCEDSFGVITYDFVNHGASDCDSHKTRAHVRNYKHLVDDTNVFVTFAKHVIYPLAKLPLPRPNRRDAPAELPLIITGISFGTLVGMHTVLSSRHQFHAAFWSGPVVGVPWTPALRLQSTVLHPLSWMAPRSRLIKPVDHELLCRDPAFLEDISTDPLACSSGMTTRSAQQVLSAMLRLRNDRRVEDGNSAFCRVPMLFLAGSEDCVADQDETRRFVDRLANDDKEFKVFAGVFHCVLEDPEREDVIAYLMRWLKARCPKREASNQNVEA